MSRIATDMVIITDRVSKRSLDFQNQKRAYVLRTVDKLGWEEIAMQVVNVSGVNPSWVTVRTTVEGFNVQKGCRKLKYSKCGRHPWKMTKDVQQFVIRRLVARRASQIVTSVTLQADLASEKGVEVEESTIRKLLRQRGYKWLPRCQKRKYTRAQRSVRVAFARAVLRLSKARLRAKLCMSMDGVVLSVPPASDIERFNYCWGGVSHMWRKRNEGNLPQLAGADDYDKQVPLARAIPLWGGLSGNGFAPILWHRSKKTNKEEWSQAVRDGKVTQALRFLNPTNKRGP